MACCSPLRVLIKHTSRVLTCTNFPDLQRRLKTLHGEPQNSRAGHHRDTTTLTAPCTDSDRTEHLRPLDHLPDDAAGVIALAAFASESGGLLVRIREFWSAISLVDVGFGEQKSKDLSRSVVGFQPPSTTISSNIWGKCKSQQQLQDHFF